MLDRFLSKSGIGRQLRQGEVLDAWRKVLGPRLSRRARAVRFLRGELVVQVDSATHLQELQNFTGEQYRHQANRLLGDERIKSVAFRLKQ
ncbi:MAG: DUF721 domain-containing protein [Planctomycetes bacterium]|nr:DUF721 domain-containing protein [Planctomycetota bacterium]